MILAAHSDLTAFILAGGRSTRMGRDKAFLEFNGNMLLSKSLSLAQSITSNIHIVGPRSRFNACGSVVEDLFSGRGPLGGIHAALTISTTDLNLMLAVDMPFLTTEFLSYLVRRARSSDAIVTIPRTQDGWQPLCAIYRLSFAPIAEAALQSGQNKIDRLFSEVALNVVTSEDLVAFPQNQFRNLNRPEDLAEADAET